MPYKVLSHLKANEVAEKIRESLLVGGDINLDGIVEERNGPFDEAGLVDASQNIKNLWDIEIKRLGRKVVLGDLALLEIQFAPKIYEALKHLSLDCLEDEDFWRYLALVPFRWYLLAREPELKPQDYGGIKKEPVIDKKGNPVLDADGNPTTKIMKSVMVNQLIFRTYLIGKAMEDKSLANPFERADAIKAGPVTDIWQSHIIRVLLGRIGVLRHSFIDRIKIEPVKDKRMFDFSRQLAKNLTRLKNNVVLDNYDKNDTDKIVDELGN